MSQRFQKHSQRETQFLYLDSEFGFTVLQDPKKYEIYHRNIQPFLQQLVSCYFHDVVVPALNPSLQDFTTSNLAEV